jgi:cation:H+ antiporter
MLFDLRSLPLWADLGLFGAAAAVVWYVGTHLARRADAIAERTGLGRAFVGLVLLAGATSLPEVATTATAAVGGNAPLAVGNVLGGVVAQTAILALADSFVRRGALTYLTPRPVLLLEGVGLVVLLAIVLAGMAAGSLVALGGVGIWTPIVFATYLLSVYLIRRYEGRGGWRPVDPPDPETADGDSEGGARERLAGASTRRLVLTFAGLGLVVLAAGYLLTRSAEALARQTGLGASFVGATLLALSTSLPEVSTTITAVRIGAYGMAISNVFGSNSFDVALVFFADLLYRPGPVLDQVDRSATFAAAAGVVVTAVYLIGLIERRDRTVWRLGVDSVAVVGLYVATTGVLYLLR